MPFDGLSFQKDLLPRKVTPKGYLTSAFWHLGEPSAGKLTSSDGALDLNNLIILEMIV